MRIPGARLPAWIVIPALIHAATLTGCAGSTVPAVPGAAPDESQVTAPNIILISIDGLRQDRTHFGGNPRRTTPNLDSLAVDGVTFTNSFSQSNESLLSHAPIFTSRYPSEIARPDYRTYTVPDSADTLAEALTAVGYDTAAFVAGGHVKAFFGFKQGFATFFEGKDFGSFFETGAQASRWVGTRATGRPFFLFLHGYDCHRPYVHESVFFHPFELSPSNKKLCKLLSKRNATELVYDGVYYPDFQLEWLDHEVGERMTDPQSYEKLAAYARTAGAQERRKVLSPDDIDHAVEHYDSAVLEADTYVGLFLENLVTQGLWDNTVVIVTADHGEDLQEHGYFNHRTVIFDSTTRVPFLVTGGAVPQAWRGERRTDLVEALDIVPTVMDIAGSVPPAGARGRSVWSLLEGRPGASKDKVFQQGVLGQSSVRTATHRLVFQGYRLTDEGYGAHLAADPIDGGSFALFASSEEPREQQEILAANLGLAEELRKAMVEWYSTLDSGVAAKPISPEIQKTLHENGYW